MSREISKAEWEAMYPTNDGEYSSDGTAGSDMPENVKRFLQSIDNKRKRDDQPYFQALSTPKPKPIKPEPFVFPVVSPSFGPRPGVIDITGLSSDSSDNRVNTSPITKVKAKNLPPARGMPWIAQGMPLSKKLVQVKQMEKPADQGMSLSKPLAQGMPLSKPLAQGMQLSKPLAQGMQLSKPLAQGMPLSKPAAEGNPRDQGNPGSTPQAQENPQSMPPV